MKESCPFGFLLPRSPTKSETLNFFFLDRIPMPCRDFSGSHARIRAVQLTIHKPGGVYHTKKKKKTRLTVLMVALRRNQGARDFIIVRSTHTLSMYLPLLFSRA